MLCSAAAAIEVRNGPVGCFPRASAAAAYAGPQHPCLANLHNKECGFRRDHIARGSARVAARIRSHVSSLAASLQLRPQHCSIITRSPPPLRAPCADTRCCCSCWPGALRTASSPPGSSAGASPAPAGCAHAPHPSLKLPNALTQSIDSRKGARTTNPTDGAPDERRRRNHYACFGFCS